MVGIASPRLAVYASVPGAGISFGSEVVLAVEMLVGCTCAAPGVAIAGLAVCAWALKVSDECGATTHPAAAKRRQKIAVTKRDDEWRKSSSAKASLSCDSSRGSWSSLVTCGLLRLTVPVPERITGVGCRVAAMPEADVQLPDGLSDFPSDGGERRSARMTVVTSRFLPW